MNWSVTGDTSASARSVITRVLRVGVQVRDIYHRIPESRTLTTRALELALLGLFSASPGVAGYRYIPWHETRHGQCYRGTCYVHGRGQHHTGAYPGVTGWVRQALPGTRARPWQGYVPNALCTRGANTSRHGANSIQRHFPGKLTSKHGSYLVLALRYVYGAVTKFDLGLGCAKLALGRARSVRQAMHWAVLTGRALGCERGCGLPMDRTCEKVAKCVGPFASSKDPLTAPLLTEEKRPPKLATEKQDAPSSTNPVVEQQPAPHLEPTAKPVVEQPTSPLKTSLESSQPLPEVRESTSGSSQQVEKLREQLQEPNAEQTPQNPANQSTDVERASNAP
ncbi:serine-aspartate repeat-containing protein E [Striga asiatica]|uniref:Serine-aspartate repeat-containing protein E n=1 Tax=Striga asiatica TaxID=4170 RepID=A0A5A7QWW6_STRAF|nr:serine-aspartate repeat-containing protein E [Striga asiatica]